MEEAFSFFQSTFQFYLFCYCNIFPLLGVTGGNTVMHIIGHVSLAIPKEQKRAYGNEGFILSGGGNGGYNHGLEEKKELFWQINWRSLTRISLEQKICSWQNEKE